MAIEQLGESLLSQARDRKKKEKKKAKLFTGLMLGVQLSNVALRKRAEKRANQFWASNKGVLDQRATQFQQGVTFWDKHNKLMSSKGIAGGGDWKDAYKEEQYAVYKARELGGSAPKDLIKFKQSVDSKIQDDLTAYEEKLNLYKDFKNISTTGREKSKTAYVKTLRDKLEKSASTITKNDNVGNFLLSQVGILGRKKADMQTTTILDGESIVTAGGLSNEERSQLMIEFKQADLLNKNVDKATSQSQYQPMSDEEIRTYMPEGTTSVKPIGSHNISLSRAVSENNLKRQESLLNEYTYTYDEKEGQTVRKIYESISEDSIQKATIFYNDVLTVSRDLQIAYEKDPSTTDVKDAEYFLDLAVKEVIRLPSKEEDAFNLNTTMISVSSENGKTAEIKAGAIVSEFENFKTEEEALEALSLYKELAKQSPDFIAYLERLVSDKFKEQRQPTDISRDSSFFQYNKKFTKNPLGN